MRSKAGDSLNGTRSSVLLELWELIFHIDKSLLILHASNIILHYNYKGKMKLSSDPGSKLPSKDLSKAGDKKSGPLGGTPEISRGTRGNEIILPLA